MRAIVNDENTTYELDTLELAMLRSATRAKHGARVTKASLRETLKEALESYCREVAATSTGNCRGTSGIKGRRRKA